MAGQNSTIILITKKKMESILITGSLLASQCIRCPEAIAIVIPYSFVGLNCIEKLQPNRRPTHITLFLYVRVHSA